MTKITLIAILLIGLNGCTFHNYHKAIVYSVEVVEDGCLYQITSDCLLTKDEFIDTCGKFQIGDTVRWTKEY